MISSDDRKKVKTRLRYITEWKIVAEKTISAINGNKHSSRIGFRKWPRRFAEDSARKLGTFRKQTQEQSFEQFLFPFLSPV